MCCQITAGRIMTLSAPDVGLLSCGFVALVGAAVCQSFIPHFTGSVVDKVWVCPPALTDRVLYVDFLAGLSSAKPV